MAFELIKQTGTTQVSSGGPVHIGSYIGPVQVINADSKTAETSYSAPHTVLSAAGSAGTNCKILTAPANATYFTLFHQYVGTITAAPVVRLYGEIPLKDKQLNHPSDIHATYSNPFTMSYSTQASTLLYGSGGFDWIPLCELSTSSWDVTVGDISVLAFTGNLGDFRSTWNTINLLGTRRIMAVIKTAATGITRGLLAGCFGS